MVQKEQVVREEKEQLSAQLAQVKGQQSGEAEAKLSAAESHARELQVPSLGQHWYHHCAVTAPPPLPHHCPTTAPSLSNHRTPLPLQCGNRES